MKIKRFFTNSFLVLISSYIPMFIASSYLFINEKKSIPEAIRIENDFSKLAKRKKIELIKEGYLPLFYPHFTKKNLIADNTIYPLGSLPYKKTLLCDEGYGFIKYFSDRFGFRNNDKKWELNSINNIYVVGDSFVHGYCVKNEDTIVANIEKKTGINTFNLGMSSSDPYEYSAVLKDLVRPILNQKKEHKNHVVLIFYANDNRSINKKAEKILSNSSSILSEENTNYFYPKPNSSYLKALSVLIKNNYPLSKKEILKEIRLNNYKDSFFSRNITLYTLRDKIRIKQKLKNLLGFEKSNNQNKIAKEINDFSITEKTIILLSKICKTNCKPIIVYIPNSLYWRPYNQRSNSYKMEIKRYLMI